MTGLKINTATSVDEIIDLYQRWGIEHYDEGLSQLGHALQTAALAVDAGASDELVVAALLHDVGHLLDLASAEDQWQPTDIDLAHESVGARYLSGLFGPGVTAPIALHVRAKRYRTAVDSEYLASLSDGSTRSLEIQGGPFNEAEVAGFEQNAGFADAVRLRDWDDLGKVDGLRVAPLEEYRPVLERVARSPH